MCNSSYSLRRRSVWHWKALKFHAELLPEGWVTRDGNRWLQWWHRNIGLLLCILMRHARMSVCFLWFTSILVQGVSLVFLIPPLIPYDISPVKLVKGNPRLQICGIVGSEAQAFWEQKLLKNLKSSSFSYFWSVGYTMIGSSMFYHWHGLKRTLRQCSKQGVHSNELIFLVEAAAMLFALFWKRSRCRQE